MLILRRRILNINILKSGIPIKLLRKAEYLHTDYNTLYINNLLY